MNRRCNMLKNIFCVIAIVILVSIVGDSILGQQYKKPTSDQIKESLKSLDRQMEEIDKLVDEMTPKMIDAAKCQNTNGSFAECWIYQLKGKNMILRVNGYQRSKVNLYEYDLDDNNVPEILKWDLGQNEKFDIIEYDINKDGKFQHAKVDMNFDGKFGDNEIYVLNAEWKGLFPGALPFPVLPVFPY